MMRTLLTALSLSAVFSTLVSCTVKVGNDSGSDGGKPPAANPEANKTGPDVVNWAGVPSMYHPEVRTLNFSTAGISKITLDVFSSGNIQVNYVAGLNAAAANIKMFTVYYNSATWGSTGVSQNGETLSIQSTGQYECSIKTENGNITGLDGGCVVHTEVNLPADTQTEVYVGSKRLGQRFRAVDSKTLLANVNSASSFDRDKVIDDYLASYQETHKTPQISSHELGEVLKEFPFTDGKMSTLKKLQAYVTDRANLAAMIDDVFSYFERNDARVAVGLPANP